MANITVTAMNLLRQQERDDYALAERQLAQVNKVVEGLFPAE